MEKKFDSTKPVQTRDGRPARIICTDRIGKFPIVALVNNQGQESAYTFDLTGRWGGGESGVHLVNIPEVRYEYQCVYKESTTAAYRHKNSKVLPATGALGYLKYTFEDDEITKVEFIKKGE